MNRLFQALAGACMVFLFFGLLIGGIFGLIMLAGIFLGKFGVGVFLLFVSFIVTVAFFYFNPDMMQDESETNK
jgi:uncharacterized membrane protein YkgB